MLAKPCYGPPIRCQPASDSSGSKTHFDVGGRFPVGLSLSILHQLTGKGRHIVCYEAIVKSKDEVPGKMMRILSDVVGGRKSVHTMVDVILHIFAERYRLESEEHIANVAAAWVIGPTCVEEGDGTDELALFITGIMTCQTIQRRTEIRQRVALYRASVYSVVVGG